jgi:glycosyltransferase involved in cell wall biosynthesis
MKRSPLVSTIIPTYNRAHLVREAVDSVLAQTYPNVELIVVDDGSTDDTQAQLKRYGNRIRVLTQQNAGPSAARNRGIEVSRGDLISFLDSDDLWLTTKLERQVSLLQEAGESVPCCLCNILMRWSDRDIPSFEISSLQPFVAEGIWNNVAEVLATRFVLFNQGALVRRHVLSTIGGFDESLRLLEDYELALRLSLQGPWAFIEEPLVVWRETAGSLYQNARRDEIGPQERLVEILRRPLVMPRTRSKSERFQKHIARELCRARRQLSAARMSQSKSRFATRLGGLLQTIERYRRALFRRSPWFPKMEVENIDSFRTRYPLTETESLDPDRTSAEFASLRQ